VSDRLRGWHGSRIVGLGLVALATVLLLVPELPLSSGHSATSDTRVAGYPQRLGFVRPAPALPDQPGPLAAVVTDNNFGNSIHLVADQRGRLWNSGYTRNAPALSPDGTGLLALTDSDEPSLRLHDLTTGRVTQFAAVPPSPGVISRLETRWSPDGTQVLLTVDRAGRGQTLLVDVVDGEISTLARHSLGAGWLSADEVVLVHPSTKRHRLVSIDVEVRRLGTRTTRRTTLVPEVPWGTSPPTSSGVSLSPGGRLLVLEGGTKEAPSPAARFFDPLTGGQLEARDVKNAAGCAISWRGEDPVVPTKRLGEPAGAVLVASDAVRPVVAIHPRQQSFCITWAADAINGRPATALFGASGALWTWYARPLGALVLALIGGALLVRRRGQGHST
jgi:hypothetical protein